MLGCLAAVGLDLSCDWFASCGMFCCSAFTLFVFVNRLCCYPWALILCSLSFTLGGGYLL